MIPGSKMKDGSSRTGRMEDMHLQRWKLMIEG